jgi:hypothetical protein
MAHMTVAQLRDRLNELIESDPSIADKKVVDTNGYPIIQVLVGGPIEDDFDDSDTVYVESEF